MTTQFGLRKASCIPKQSWYAPPNPMRINPKSLLVCNGQQVQLHTLIHCQQQQGWELWQQLQVANKCARWQSWTLRNNTATSSCWSYAKPGGWGPPEHGIGKSSLKIQKGQLSQGPFEFVVMVQHLQGSQGQQTCVDLQYGWLAPGTSGTAAHW